MGPVTNTSQRAKLAPVVLCLMGLSKQSKWLFCGSWVLVRDHGGPRSSMMNSGWSAPFWCRALPSPPGFLQAGKRCGSGPRCLPGWACPSHGSSPGWAFHRGSLECQHSGERVLKTGKDNCLESSHSLIGFLPFQQALGRVSESCCPSAAWLGHPLRHGQAPGVLRFFSPIYSRSSPPFHPSPSPLSFRVPTYICFQSLPASVMPAGKASRVRLSGKRCDQQSLCSGRSCCSPLAEEIPGEQTRFYSQGAAHRRCEARCTPLLLSWARSSPFRGGDCVWTRAAGNESWCKNIHPFEKAEGHISFKPYLNQLVKTWNISGQIRFIWNKEKYSNFGGIKLKVQCSCSWANWCSGKWGLDRFQRFPFLCWQSEKRGKRLLLVFVPKANHGW